MLKQLTGAGKPKGIAGAPVPKRMTAAQGGIVGFQSGNQVIYLPKYHLNHQCDLMWVL